MSVAATVRPDPVKGALAGLAAGLVASLVMAAAQALMDKLSSSEGGGEPATQQAADRMSEAATGAPVPDDNKPVAGQAVHYITGAGLGLAYGLGVEFQPTIAAVRGAAFGLGTAIILDEAAVPAAGVGEPPWRTSPGTHLYSAVAHLVFGVTAEASRRVVRRALG